MHTVSLPSQADMLMLQNVFGQNRETQLSTKNNLTILSLHNSRQQQLQPGRTDRMGLPQYFAAFGGLMTAPLLYNGLLAFSTGQITT